MHNMSWLREGTRFESIPLRFLVEDLSAAGGGAIAGVFQLRFTNGGLEAPTSGEEAGDY